MGARLDYLSGAGYGSEAGTTGDVDGRDAVSDTGGGYFTAGSYGSGLLQSITALGTGYLSRRLDIDLARRVEGMQPEVRLPTTQQGIGMQRVNPPQPGGVSMLARNDGPGGMPAWVMLAGAGLLAFLLLRRA